MRFKYFVFCVLLFYNATAEIRELECPEFCTCDLYKSFRRASCQSKKLVSAEIGMSPEIEILDVSYNQISELGNRVFAEMGLAELRVLNMSNNKINQIHMFAFDGMDSLLSLDLSYNYIEYFMDQWFTDLKNLQELYLQGNNLVLINKQPRLHFPKLKILDLSQSKIEHFDPDVFSQLPSLEVLDISSNYIQNINADIIAPLQQLKLLVNKKNNIYCKDKSIQPFRNLINGKGIKYFGPCMRKGRKFFNKMERMMVEPINTQKVKKSDIPMDLPNSFDAISKYDNPELGENFEKLLSNSVRSDKSVDKLNETDVELLDQLKKLLSSNKSEKLQKSTDSPKEKEKSDEPADENALLNNLKEYFKSNTLVEGGGENSDSASIIKKISLMGSNNGSRNAFDKIILEVVEMSPALTVMGFALVGLMSGLIIGCAMDIKDLPKVVKVVKRILLIIRRRPRRGPKKSDKNHTKIAMDDVEEDEEEEHVKQNGGKRKGKKQKEDDEEDFIQEILVGDVEAVPPTEEIIEELVVEEVEAPPTEEPPSNDHEHHEEDDCDDCIEEREILANRKKKRSRSNSPSEEQSFLIENETGQDESTPILGKKEFSDNEEHHE